MPVYAAGYYLVGSYSSNSYTAELYEYSDGSPNDYPVTQKDFIISDDVLIIGTNTPTDTHLRGELQLSMIDELNFFRDAFASSTPGQFYVKVDDGNSLYYGVPATDFIGGQFWKKFNLRSFVFSDGLVTLKSVTSIPSDYVQLGEFLYDTLQEIPYELDLNMLFNYQHDGADGQAGIVPNQLRIIPSDYKSDSESTLHDVLTAVLEDFKLQIWQENGEWWIAQRNIRGESQTLYTRNSGGWSTSVHNSEVELGLSSLLSAATEDLQIQPIQTYTREIQQPMYEFETLNPRFSIWESGQPKEWSGSGTFNDPAGLYGVEFIDQSTYLSQTLKRIVRYGDIINFKFDAEYNIESGLADGVYNFNIAKVEAIDLGATSTNLWLRENGTWATSETFIKDSVAPVSGTYPTNLTKNIDVEADPLPIQFVGYIVITIQLSGADVVDDITYDTVNLTPVSLEDAVDTVKYFGQTLAVGTSSSDVINRTESTLYAASPSIQYYDGADWLPINEWTYNAHTYDLTPLVLTLYLQQFGKNNLAFRLETKLTGAVKLSQRVIFGDGKVYIPHRIELRRKDKTAILTVCELSLTSGVSVAIIDS